MTSLIVAFILAKAPNNHTLRGASDAVAKTLLAKDWLSFRKLATETLTVEEYWTAYPDYFEKRHHPIREIEDRAALQYIGGSTVIPNQAHLTTGQANSFQTFAEQMRQSRSYTPRSWGDWPDVEASGYVERNQYAFLAPCAYCKVASNLYLGIEFVRINARYLVRRLIWTGH